LRVGNEQYTPDLILISLIVPSADLREKVGITRSYFKQFAKFATEVVILVDNFVQ